MPTTNYEQLRRIMQGRKVRDKLAEVADKLAQRVDQLAASGPDPDEDQAVRSDGTRPKGRPYSRVAVPAGQEYGNSAKGRRRLLGRAVTGK